MKILFIALFIISQSLMANVAMPGMWNTGSGRKFIPYFREDSVHIGKVQMLSESIFIQLYQGYAVVKGSYRMVNLTNESFSLRLGFPINGRYEHPQFNNVSFDKLHSLRVFNADSEAVVLQLEDYLKKRNQKDFSTDSIKNFYSTFTPEDALNWYVWETYFTSNDTLDITVYYILNTNNASYRQGYDVRHYNVFSYILETGEAWAGYIEEGEIRIQLMDELNVSDIHGAYPFSAFMTNGVDMLVRKFTTLEPTPSDNIVIAYGEPQENFTLDTVLSASERYYQKIETASTQPFLEKNYFLFEEKDFEPLSNFLTWLITGGIGALLLGGAIVYVIIRLITG